MKRSTAELSTRIRERAQQSWPALPNTPPGAAAAAASMSASAKTRFADLPPSSSVTRLIVCAAPAAIPRPTSVEPVNATLATSGCSTSREPHTEPGPATTLRTPSGRPASTAIRSSSSEVSGVSAAGLRTIVLPAASAGATFHEAITSGKFHGVIRPTTPSGSRNVISTPPATGIVRPSEALRAPGVVAEALGDHRDLAASVGDRLAGVASFERRELVGAGRSTASEIASMRRARSPGATARQAPNAAFARATAASVSSTPARGTSASTFSVAGSITSIVGPGLIRALRRGRPRRALRRSPRGAPPRDARRRRAPSGAPGTSIASISSPGSDQPLATMPSPSSPMPWWWWEWTVSRSEPAARAASESGSSRTSWIENRPGVSMWTSVSGEMLVEGAAERDVEELHPAAGPEHRHVAVERGAAPARSRTGRARP